ncbi:hypothetical protein, partial [Klebsiella pneumoniae]|uniref:hypothetical protein n=1 Tax=Klebsiella pneumoniae TaxID=573 RepID=UPI0039C0049F
HYLAKAINMEKIGNPNSKPMTYVILEGRSMHHFGEVHLQGRIHEYESTTLGKHPQMEEYTNKSSYTPHVYTTSTKWAKWTSDIPGY